MWKDIDFVAAWKAISIALTGAFGVLGLFTEFKDKDTKKVTKWGYVSLVGILVSACFGIWAQLKESSDSANKALTVAQTSNDMLHQVRRLVSPIGSPSLAIRFEIGCEHPESLFNDFCKDLRSTQRAMLNLDPLDRQNMDRLVQLSASPKTSRRWPYKDNVFMQVQLNLFRNRVDADRFWNSDFKEPEPDLKLGTGASLKDRDTKKLKLEVYQGMGRATMRFPTVTDMSSSGKITSFEDLDGATLIVTSPLGYVFSVASPTAIVITNQQGQSIQVSGPFDKKSTDRKVLTDEPWGYRYFFPKSEPNPPKEDQSKK